MPTLSALAPASVSAGSGAFTLTLSGSGFIVGAVAFFADTVLATTFVDATTVQAAVPAYLVASPGGMQVVISNPTQGGSRASTPIVFSIDAFGDAGGPQPDCVQKSLFCDQLERASGNLPPNPTLVYLDFWTCDRYPGSLGGPLGPPLGPLCETAQSMGIDAAVYPQFGIGIDAGGWCCCRDIQTCGCNFAGTACGTYACCNGPCDPSGHCP